MPKSDKVNDINILYNYVVVGIDTEFRVKLAKAIPKFSILVLICYI